MSWEYKVVEVAPVDDETLEKAINKHTPEGWELDQVGFIQEAGVRRPGMAFVFLKRTATSDDAPRADP